MASSLDPRRAGVAAVRAAILLGVLLGAVACGAGDQEPSARPSAGAPSRQADRTTAAEPDATRDREATPERETTPEQEATPEREPTPEREATPERETTQATATTRATRSPAVVIPEPGPTTPEPDPPAPATRQPAPSTAAAPAPARTTPPPAPAATTTTRSPTPAQTTPEPSAAVEAAADESPGVGLLACLVPLVLVAALVVGGVLVGRSRRMTAWDSEARALESETRAVATVRLPPVLATTTVGERSTAWPPVRAALTETRIRWDRLADRAADAARGNWSMRISGLLHELTAAVDAENEALVAGQDWMRLRPAVDRAADELTEVLSGVARPEPALAGEPWPPSAGAPGPPPAREPWPPSAGAPGPPSARDPRQPSAGAPGPPSTGEPEPPAYRS